MYVHQVATCALGGDMCARWRHVRQVEGMCAMCARWGMGLGHVRQVGECAPGGCMGAYAPGGGRCARWGHVPQVGACAPGGGMCTAWVHVRQLGERSEYMETF